MALLTREQILGVQDLATERVEVPEWGGDILVRGMNGFEREEWENTPADKFDVRARVVAACAVDESGKPIFNKADAQALGAKSSAALSRVFSVIVKLSAVRKDEVEALEGNSEAEAGDTSSSS